MSSTATERGRALKRSLTLLRLLADGQLHERRRLAAALGVSPRTIRRDVAALMFACVPIQEGRTSDEWSPSVAAYRLDPGELRAWFAGAWAV
jgi:predicted DNA-binding transcriptional regulator YafY